jgi:heterodisulfide reductase subunit A
MVAKDKVGAVLIVGGGISGMQSALDLGDSGFKVYLVDKKPTIGGVMAQLDKTFPTNDCSMCIMAPKLVATGKHNNVEIITNAEVDTVEGEAGHFRVNLVKQPRRVSEEVCTGCGICSQKCPVEAIDLYNEGTMARAAIYVDYPQAVPLKYHIDKERCIGCGICEGECPADAIEYDQREELRTLDVGSVILSPGFDEFGPEVMKEYGHGKYPNVVSSIEFERMLSATGPYRGTVMRPSDGRIPEKVAFIQCVGSRTEQNGHNFCSSVCCMHAIKEAMIAQEHTEGLSAHIYFMDIRAFGKEFDDYVHKAKNDFGIGITRSNRVADITQVPDSKDLVVRYIEGGDIKVATYQMVVLSVGLHAPKSAGTLAGAFGIELNHYDFARTGTFSPLETTVPGVYVSGAFSGPKDIPTTVAEASGAAAKAALDIYEARGTQITEVELPPERDVEGEEPRIGVFICHCGINIGGVVDIPDIVEYVSNLDNVVHVERNLYTCSQDTQERIKEKIAEHELNRVVVASCTPRTHEPLFQNTTREGGLNQYLFEMANIRDQCSWIHMHEPDLATSKARDLVKMAVAKARLLEPLAKSSIPVTQTALVVGGGISGMTAALDIADQGFMTYIVEKDDELGGIARRIKSTLDGEDVKSKLAQMVDTITKHKNIQAFVGDEIEYIEGYVGNFQTKVKSRDEPIEHGVVILATGGEEYKPKEYLYGDDPRVVTQLEFEEEMAKVKKADLPDSVVFINCVGSRSDDKPWCSRVCCGASVKEALLLKKKNPAANVYVLYRDLRTYSLKEDSYKEAAEKGIIFIRYHEDHPPVVRKEGDGLVVNIKEDLLQEKLAINADRIVLAAAILPPEANEAYGQMLKVPLSKDGFFLEAHMKLRPVDFATEGVFLCGLAHSPKHIDESIGQASGAAARALTILSSDTLEAEGIIAHVNDDVCDGCGICRPICEYNAIEIDDEKKLAIINETLCKGCGACVGACPSGAMEQKGYKDSQLLAMIEAALEGFGQEVVE